MAGASTRAHENGAPPDAFADAHASTHGLPSYNAPRGRV